MFFLLIIAPRSDCLRIFHKPNDASGFLNSEEESKQSCMINFSTLYNRDANIEEKENAGGKPSNKIKKVDFPSTWTRVIACLEQISDP